MRAWTKALAGVTAAGLAVTLTACSSSGSKKSGPKPQAQLTTLTGGTTTLAISPSFAGTAVKLGVVPAVYGTAKLSGLTNLVLPITGGNLTVYKKGDATPPVQGSVEHKGSGISLGSGAKKVTLKDFVINANKADVTGTVLLNGKTLMSNAELFTLDESTMQPPATSSGSITLSGATVKLASQAAAELNTVAGKKLLNGGVAVGTITVAAKGK
jgi:hypothetical protein